VVHYSFTVPEDAEGTVEVIARLNYRKFDTLYMRYFQGEEFAGNDLPVLRIAEDQLEFPVGAHTTVSDAASDIPEWQRWYDYGIGLLRKQGLGELRQAEAAFEKVEELGRAEGPLGRSRVYIREGRLGDAVSALNTAAQHDPPAYPWSVSYFTGLVNKQNGYLDEALESFRSVIDTQFQEAQDRNFDFSRDYRLLNEYAGTLFERAKLERGDARKTERDRYLGDAVTWFQHALAQDPENVTANYGLAQAYTQLGQEEDAERHRRLHARYREDDNARDRAIGMARRKSAAADHASDAVVIYDLQRDGAHGLTTGERIAQE
jgi:tetratricopeptide (TPR) repeat protein